MSGRVSLRGGDERDVPAVIALMDEAVAWLVARGQSGQWGTEPFSARPERQEHMFRLVSDGELRVAELAGEPAGAMVVGPPPPTRRRSSAPSCT